MHVLRIDAVASRVSYHPVHLRRLIKAGKFPAPIRLGENRVVWIESEVDEWLETKREKRDAALEAKRREHDAECKVKLHQERDATGGEVAHG
jgi:prophage regulatory protein